MGRALYGMTDFDAFLKETGITPGDMEAAKCYYSAQVAQLLGVAATRVKVAKSEIEGFGLMACTDLEPGESFEALSRGQWTEAGRFTNHSSAPSMVAKLIWRGLEFVVVKPLKTGEELTVDYRQVKSLCLNSG